MVPRGEALGNGEAVHAGQLDVEKDDLRPQATRRLERGLAIGGLPEHVEAVDLEQRPRPGAEVGVVVDDQQAPDHADHPPTPEARQHRGYP